MASALDTYYAATYEAKELVEQNLLDEGIEKWNRALDDAAPHISSEELDALKRDFAHFFRSLDDDRELDYSSEKADDRIEESGKEGGNDNPDVGGSAMIEDYQAEHLKLVKRPTMRLRRTILRASTLPHSHYTLRPAATLPPGDSPLFKEDEKISSSPTVSILELRGTPQVPRTSFWDDDDRSHPPRARSSEEETNAMKPTISDPMTISEPTTSPAVDESNCSGSPRTEDHQVARSSAEPRPSTAPGRLMGSKENKDWFDNLESIAHDFVYGDKKQFWPTQPVKVAILDSGFALTGEAHKAMKPYSSRVKDKKTFTHEFPNPKTPLEKQRALDDPVGHGTTVAYQLMKTSPSAHVYMAKVTIAESAHKKAVPDKGAVARAIRHAATPVNEGGWGVDVINMSFGWDESELPGTAAAADGVSGAVEFADKQGVLLFAAASNYGLTHLNDVLYPARDPRVVSVDAEDGLGNPAPFALNSLRGGGGVRYCAPGLSVDSPVSAVPMSGSSFACPVAAGVAALVLEFSRRKDVSLSKSESVKSALSSARGMSKVFGPMSQQAVNHPGFNMLYPWHFLRHVQREKVALDIIGQLEIEFGKGNVGHELVWTVAWQPAQTPPSDRSVVQATPGDEDTVMTGLHGSTIS